MALLVVGSLGAVLWIALRTALTPSSPFDGVLVQSFAHPGTEEYPTWLHAELFVATPFFGPLRTIMMTGAIKPVYTSTCTLKIRSEAAYEIDPSGTFGYLFASAGPLDYAVTGPPHPVLGLPVPHVAGLNRWWAGIEFSLNRACTAYFSGFDVTYKSEGVTHIQELRSGVAFAPIERPSS